MSRPPDNIITLGSETLSLCEYTQGGHKGFWLYDKTRSMNLAMRVPTERAAFVDALEYYQVRLARLEKEHAELQGKVQAFVCQFTGSDDN